MAVELKAAYRWQCPNRSCRRVHFVLPIQVEPDLADVDEVGMYRDMLGLKAWEDLPRGPVEVCPQTVTCSSCGRKYTTATSAVK